MDGGLILLAAELCLDPEYDFPGAERLGDIVIPAAGQPQDLVDIIVFGRQK